MSERNDTYEVYRDAQGNLQCSACVLPARFKYQVRYQVCGVVEVIEGEQHSYDNVWLFCANPEHYPAEHTDVYGVALDAKTIDEFSYQFVVKKCGNLRNLVIDRF